MTPAEAWARLLGVEELARLQVLVDARSPVTRAGWIGILAIGDTVTVRVPRPDLVEPLTDAIAGLRPDGAIDPSVVIARLPPGTVGDVLGPAALFYPPPGYSPSTGDGSEVGGPRRRGARVCLHPGRARGERHHRARRAGVRRPVG